MPELSKHLRQVIGGNSRQIVASIGIFSDSSRKFCNIIQMQCVARILLPVQILFLEGDPAEHGWLLLNGIQEFWWVDRKVDEVLTKPGSLIGETVMLGLTSRWRTSCCCWTGFGTGFRWDGKAQNQPPVALAS